MPIILTKEIAVIGARVRCNNTYHGPVEATITSIEKDADGRNIFLVCWDHHRDTLPPGDFCFDEKVGLDWEWLSNPENFQVEKPCEICQHNNFVNEVKVCYWCGSKV